MVTYNKPMIHLLHIINENYKAISSAFASVCFFVLGNLCNVFYRGIDLDAMRFYSYVFSILSAIIAITYTMYKFCKDLKKKQ